jgi:lysophosphatidate acyltransferase
MGSLYALLSVFIDYLSGHTKKVHIHLSKIPISEVPAEDQAVSKWLYTRFQLKDELVF